MGWTYEADLTDDKDQLRFLIQDTDTNRQLFSDEELIWLLRTEANVYMAAACACGIMLTKARGGASKSVGDLSISYGNTFWENLQKRFRSRGMIYQIPTAGGISITAKELLEDNTDWPDPDFARKMHDNPGGLSSNQRFRKASDT